MSLMPPPSVSVSLLLLLVTPPALASNNNFCGTTWSAASTSCEERRHCPTGSDDECTAPEICYADTLCDASKGHGAKAAVAGLSYLLDIAYEDVKNRKFCGSWWAAAQESCGLDTFCGVEPDGCQDFMSCYETQCHVQDLVAQEMGSDWKELLTGSSNNGEGENNAVKLDEKDVRRSNYCGTTWADATATCGVWCLGEDTDCPGNLKCFAETTCYYDEDLVPTVSPTVSPPTTESPISSDDPRNNQFCGETWADAIEKCTPETNCGHDGDCPEGQSCHGYLPGCDLNKMGDAAKKEDNEAETLWFRKNDVTNTFFCGESYVEAVEECSIETHCPDNKCPEGKTCFQYIKENGCDVYEIWMNLTPKPTPMPTVITESPTEIVTDEPAKQPTTKPPTMAPVPVKYGLCAKDPEHLLQVYRTASECSNIEPCQDIDLTCLFDVDFESVSEKQPTKEPSKRPSKKPSKKPSLSPTHAPRKEFFTLAPVAPAISQLETILPQITTESEAESSESLVSSDEQTETVVQPPYVKDTEIPTYSDSVEINDLKFYCAVSVSELKTSCDSALECTHGLICPEGQGCIHYDCDENDNSTIDDDDTNGVDGSADDDDNDGIDITNFIPDCPVDFSGFTSRSEVHCKLYYECKDGEIGEASLCDEGLKYDVIRNMCWYEDEVDDSTCRGPPMDNTLEPTVKPSHRPTYDTSNLICPESLVGAISGSDTNCKMYYDCHKGEVGAINTCSDEFKYDIVRQMCWYKEEVSEHCYGPPIGQSMYESNENAHQSQNNEVGGSQETNTATNECLDGYTGWAARNGCRDYYWCTNGRMERDILHCVENLLFDLHHGICKHAHEVECNRTLEMPGSEPPTEVDNTRYAWPESDRTSAVAEDRNPDVGEWAYSRTQVNINNLGFGLKPNALCIVFISLIINIIHLIS